MSDGSLTKCNYELIGIQLTSDFVAVYAVDAGEGKFKLDATPLDAIGVAKVEECTYVGGKEVNKLKRKNDVVGLYLKDGFWQVANDEPNFSGVCKRGGDIRTAIGELLPKYRTNLIPEFVLPEDE